MRVNVENRRRASGPRTGWENVVYACCFVGTCILRYPLLHFVQQCHVIQRGGHRRVNGGAYALPRDTDPSARVANSAATSCSPAQLYPPQLVSVCASVAPTEESMAAAAAATAVARWVCRRERPLTRACVSLTQQPRPAPPPFCTSSPFVSVCASVAP